MRTYKEPKRIDKARARDPGYVNIDEGISKLSALSGQLEEENVENSSDKDEEMVDEDVDSGVQENHIDEEEEDMEEDGNEENLEEKSKDESPEQADIDTSVTSSKKKTSDEIDCPETGCKKKASAEAEVSEASVKKKTPPKKMKKVVENNLENCNDEVNEKKKAEVDGEKSVPETHAKSKKAVKEPTKRKLPNKKKGKDLEKEVLNNCVVDLGNKEKISPKSKSKSRSTKLKPQLPQKLTVETELEDSHKEESEKSSLNTSDSMAISPRSSKRTPVKNRKYQSDEELEINKDETDSSGKKKRSRSKSPRCSTPKKRKLDFDESEFSKINDDDFIIKKDSESAPLETSSKKTKKVVKSPKNKIVKKADIILKPKAVKKKKKLMNSEGKSVIDEGNEMPNKIKNEKSEENNIDESFEQNESLPVKVKKKRTKKLKVEKKETDTANLNDTMCVSKSEEGNSESKNPEDIPEDESDSKTENKSCNKDMEEDKNDDNKTTDVKKDGMENEKEENLDSEQEKLENNLKVDGEKSEKKEKRKMKPLEEIVCSYCKKVSVGKAANTRHLKKCYVYQAKLEMQRQENEHNELNENDSKMDQSTSENQEIDRTLNEVVAMSHDMESKDDQVESGESDKKEENQSEDKENQDNSFTKGNESTSSENKSDNATPSRKRSKPDVIYNCQHCDYTANKRAMLARHLHSHSIYMCLRCSFFCESDDELKDHMHREHKDRMDHKLCRKCSRYIHCAEITLELHMENCQGPVPFKCPHCEKEFKYESSLKSHVVKHDPDGPKKFSCPQCSYKSNYKANLKKHLVNIHSSRIKQFKCTYEECEKMFHSEDNMKRHLKWHKTDRVYKCQHCDKEFKSSGALSGHCVVHVTSKSFKCTIDDCEKAFRSQKLLKNHLQDFHHQAEKKFVCEHQGCDFSFFKRSHLDRHLVTHSGERKYGCSYCGKAFRHADNLRVHLRQHTNEKPVSCNMCEFKCRQKSSLRYHQQKCHNIVFKKGEKRKSESNTNNGDMKSVFDDNLKSVDSSMEIIMAVVNAVAKYDGDVATQNDDNKDKTDTKSELASAINSTKPDSPVTNKAVDLYEFKSDDEFGDDSVLVPLPLPVQRKINHVTPNKSNEKIEIKVEEKVGVGKEDEQTDVEHNEDDKLNVSNESTEKTEKPVSKPKVVRRGKKKKINYAEPETDISFETVEVKEESKAEVEKQKPNVKRKRGPRKGSLKAETAESKEKTEPENKEVKPKGRRGRKKIEKIPKKRGRKPKIAVVEEKVKKPETKPGPKKKMGRPRKIKPPEPEEETKEEEKEEEKKPEKEESSDEENESLNSSDKDEDRTIPGARDDDDDTLDVPLITSPKADDDDDTREYGDENLKENALEAAKLLNQEKEKSDNEQEGAKEEEEKKEALVEKEGSIAEKHSELDSDKMSSGIDTDFEDDIKPPPAPRPPPVVDSDEGDIESGPDDLDTPGRDFESTPPKSNLTEHIHSVPAHTPRDFESSPPKSVQTLDYGPSTLSQTGFETRKEGDSVDMVEAVPGSYSGTPSREVSIEEKREEREVSLPYSHLETETLPNTHSPLMEPVPPGPQANGNNDYGSQSESTMPEVDKDYLGQYLQQFDSASRSEDDRIERLNPQIEQASEPIALQNSPEKDLPPLNLSANAPPLNLSTSSNDRENSQGSDMSNKRMEILSIDRQQEDHYSSRSENVSRSSDRIPDNVYESINSMNTGTFLPPTTREATHVHSAENPFPSVSTPSTFMRFSESDALLQRQRMTTPFLPQGDPNALQNLHRMADNALAQHNNASLLRRPTTVPPREDMFSSSTAAMAQTIARNPFHNSWASQEVRPAHWSQNPYLGRTIDRPAAATSSALFGKDNYLAGREFMFDTSRRAVTDRNVFPGLPQTQRPELAHDTFPMERFDIGSYFSGHTYPGASSLTEYNRAAAAHTSQKTFDERYRQSSTGITDFRALPQTTASSMFSSNMLNSSFHLDKYMYSRDPVYHAQHIPDAGNSPFLPPGVPGQHSVFDREYTRGYFQNSPYSLDKQYAAAAAASAKLSHPSGASVVQERDFVPRPGTAAATGDNQVQDAYRHPMLYNMMNHRFYE